MRRSLLLASSASVLLVAGALLAGCTTPAPEPTVSPTPTRGSSETPDASGTPTPSPSASAAPPASIPVDVPCEQLVSLKTMYDFNPNFSLLGSWTPEAGTPASEAVAADGVACRWQNDSSGDTIDVSVAAFDDAGIAAKRADASSGETASYGYFRSSGGVGMATAIDGSYWVVVRSAWFVGASDAQPIVDAAVAALP